MQHKTVIMKAVQCCIFSVNNNNETKQKKSNTPKQIKSLKWIDLTKIWTILLFRNQLVCFVSRTEMPNQNQELFFLFSFYDKKTKKRLP